MHPVRGFGISSGPKAIQHLETVRTVVYLGAKIGWHPAPTVTRARERMDGRTSDRFVPASENIQ